MTQRIRPEQMALLQERLGRKCGNLVVSVKRDEVSVEPVLPFHIRKEQQDLLAERMKRRFIFKAVRILPQLAPSWGEGKSELEKVEIVEEMIAFAESYSIREEINVVKLLVWQEEQKLSRPLDEALEYVLGRKQLSENFRMKQISELMTTGEFLIPITLDA